MARQRKGDGLVRHNIVLKEKSYDKMISICSRKNQIPGSVLNDLMNEAIDKFNEENGGKLK